jgi:hypothetical protein
MGSTLIPPGDAIAAQMRRRRSLANANHTRAARAALMRRLANRSPAESCRMAADLVNDPPEVLQTMTAFDLLEHVRQIGGPTARRILSDCDVPELQPLLAMPANERIALESALRNRAETPTSA